MIDLQLENKIVLITGANHGIGAATAKIFAAQKAKVFVTFHRDASRYSEEELSKAKEAGIGGDELYRAMQQQSADSLISQIETEGGIAFAQEFDLANPENVPALFELCESKLGSVDILINNHTHCTNETFDPALVGNAGSRVYLANAASIDEHFAINARAYTLMMSEYLQRHLKRNAKWGRIVNVSTDAAHAHVANISYAASKHAIESYSRSAAAEMGKYGITVNIVAPGPIQTGYITPENEKIWAAESPLGRIGRPEDVAEIMVFLASEQAHWLTGQLLYVGGGSRMHQ